ncbi:MAG: septum formation initiator family protein [bacterium]|nr:septum formation initiator family protein [bacterium]MDE0501936.1 septum formation initiator family protein [bacterium]
MSEEESARKSKRSWRSRWLWIAGAAILAAGATVYAVPILDRLEEQTTNIAEYAEELDELVAQNTELEERLDALHTPIEIERLARERLGYVREGETAFVVVSPRDPDPAPSAEDPVEMAEMIEEEPWYSRWWSYLSGSDLSADS